MKASIEVPGIGTAVGVLFQDSRSPGNFENATLQTVNYLVGISGLIGYHVAVVGEMTEDDALLSFY